MINIDRTAEQNDILLTLDATDTSGLRVPFSFRRLNEKGILIGSRIQQHM